MKNRSVGAGQTNKCDPFSVLEMRLDFLTLTFISRLLKIQFLFTEKQ